MKTSSPLAIQYNDLSPLENHHLAQTFRLLNRDDCGLLRHLSKDKQVVLLTIVTIIMMIIMITTMMIMIMIVTTIIITLMIMNSSVERHPAGLCCCLVPSVFLFFFSQFLMLVRLSVPDAAFSSVASLCSTSASVSLVSAVLALLHSSISHQRALTAQCRDALD